MRLYPPVTKEEALAFLTNQAAESWGADAAKEMQTQLGNFAEAMAAVSAIRIKDDVEPLLTRYWPA